MLSRLADTTSGLARAARSAAEAAVNALDRADVEARRRATELLHAAGRGREGAGADVEHGAAPVADGVVVRLGVGVEPRRVAALARQADDAGEPGPRERVERVVDGREAHRRERRAEPLEEVLRRRVRLVLREEAHDGDAAGA